MRETEMFIAAIGLAILALFAFVAYLNERKQRIIYQNLLSLKNTEADENEKEFARQKNDLSYYKKRLAEEIGRARHYEHVADSLYLELHKLDVSRSRYYDYDDPDFFTSEE